jgi:hypothetical protein
MNNKRITQYAAALAAAFGGLSHLHAQAVIAVPPGFALPANSVVTAEPGFRVKVSQVNNESGTLATTIARAEAQLAGKLIDPKTGVPFVNDIDKVSFAFDADGYYNELGTIAYEQGGAGANGSIPGVPGVNFINDNIALEALSYLQLAAGEYTMIVNSDDGFRLSVGRDARDKLASIVLGEFDAGRGAGDTVMKFSISQAGVYSFRLVYFEGGGGASVDWLTSPSGDTANDRVPVNGAGGVAGFRRVTAALGPYVSYAVPAKGAARVSPTSAVSLELADGPSTQVAPGSIALSFDGQVVAPTVAKTGSVTKVDFDPPGLLAPLSTHTVKLVYADTASPANSVTNEYSFTVAAYANINLPTPIAFENFESAEEGTLPAGWSGVHFSSSESGTFDLLSPTSDSYLGWTVISRATVVAIGEAGGWDPARRLNVSEAYVNGQQVASLVNGKFAYAESDQRGGSQVQYLFSPDYDLTGKTSIYVAWNSIYEQNQDNVASAEYSIDGGTTWLPILYMVEEADLIKKADGTVDGVATLNAPRTDTAKIFDPVTGEVVIDPETGVDKVGTYGSFIGAPITDALSPFVQGRVNDDATESKRVEFYRLPQADNQAKVRFRFAQAGTASWYFGIDDLGLYSITVIDPPIVGSNPADSTVVAGQTAVLKASGNGTGLTYQWQFNQEDIDGQTTATLTLANVTAANAGKYRLKIMNAGGSVETTEATLTVLPQLSDLSGLKTGLATYLKFDGNLNDASGNNLNGVEGGTVSYAPGKVGSQAVAVKTGEGVFNFVSLERRLLLGNDDFSVSFWAKLNSWSGDPGLVGNKDWNSGGNRGFVIATDGDGRVQWNYRSIGGDRKDYDGPGGTFNGGVWRHVVVTFDRGGFITTFVDGQQVTDKAPVAVDEGSASDTDSLAFNIGQDGTGTYGSALDALIDDVAVWRRAIGVQEIEAVYRVGNTGKSFDEAVAPLSLGSATVANDQVVLNWTGGTGPFLVQGKLSLSDPNWLDLQTVSGNTASIPTASPIGFFRVVDGATKTVKLFKATLNAAQEVATPPVVSPATGVGLLALDGTTVTYVVSYENLVGTITASHLHGPAAAGANAGVQIGFVVVTGTKSGVIAGQATADAATVTAIEGGNTYFNVHTTSFGGGEIRGQVTPVQ